MSIKNTSSHSATLQTGYTKRMGLIDHDVAWSSKMLNFFQTKHAFDTLKRLQSFPVSEDNNSQGRRAFLKSVYVTVTFPATA